MELHKNKILLALSGGVDSSVAASILVEQGYEVEALTFTHVDISMKNGENLSPNTCHLIQSVKDAADVCDKLGIKHHVVDISKRFKEQIVDGFIDEYLNGRTPNPCVKCNPTVKWDIFISKADEIGAAYVATGHYSDIRYDEKTGRHTVAKGKDPSKDQSYVLWGLSQDQLSRTIFPLNSHLKNRTRELAFDSELPVFNKAESQEICFIPDNDYRKFIKKAVPDIDDKIGEGYIIKDGKILGKHQGYQNYTIGQRKGLGISYKVPLYVKSIDSENNVIVVAENEELKDYGLIAGNINMIKYETITEQTEFNVKIRYNDKGVIGKCRIENEKLIVEFEEFRRAITPGQSVVLYEGDELVGGGIIEEYF